jgi:predicted nucleic acid-binding protein
MPAELVFVDTNVLLYQWDATEPEKQARATAWMKHLWRSKRGRVSYQVLAEFYVTATQKLKPGMAPPAAQWNVRTLLAWKPVAPNGRLFERAWGVQARYGTSWWDALIVAAAQIAGCGLLLSEDLQDEQQLDELTVLSPFTHEPEAA